MREQRLVFDEVAELYARRRPGYPPALIDAIVDEARLEASARVLEIGCGPGLATLPFAERGYRLTAVEPGAEMVRLARERLQEFDVEVIHTSFEDWAGDRGYALVFAAQAFHWVDPERRFSLAADRLALGGYLAIFANLPQSPEGEVHDAIQAVYARHADAFAMNARLPGSGSTRRAPLHEEFEASDEFGSVLDLRFPWTARYDADAYVELMATQSDHLLLPPEALADLHAGIHQAIHDHGNAVEIPYEAKLLLGQRAGEAQR
jgi:trans-aconitate methyltransferase